MGEDSEILSASFLIWAWGLYQADSLREQNHIHTKTVKREFRVKDSGYMSTKYLSKSFLAF